jgi:rhomboid protease GluP
MSEDPLYIRILEKLGVNTTRLKWKLYQKERKVQDIARTGIRPKGLQWLSYPHKICSHCHAINDKEARECSSCNRRLPNMLIYKISRLLTSAASGESPVIIQGFLGLMLLFFAIEISFGGFSMENIMMPDNYGLQVLGAFTTHIFQGPFQWFRWTAFGLLHGGLIHIGFNGYALYQIGPIIESQIGRARMLVLITVSQLGAALACYLWYFEINKINTLVIGASGWVFGLLGFGIILFHRMGIPSIRNQLSFWAVFMLGFGFMVGGISNAAHIGGMLGGMLIAILPAGGNVRMPGIDKAWAIIALFSILLWSVTIVFMFVSLSFNA